MTTISIAEDSVVEGSGVLPLMALCPVELDVPVDQRVGYKWVKIGNTNLFVTPIPDLLTPTIMYNDGTSEPTSLEYFQKCLLTCSGISSAD